MLMEGFMLGFMLLLLLEEEGFLFVREWVVCIKLGWVARTCRGEMAREHELENVKSKYFGGLFYPVKKVN